MSNVVQCLKQSLIESAVEHWSDVISQVLGLLHTGSVKLHQVRVLLVRPHKFTLQKVELFQQILFINAVGPRELRLHLKRGESKLDLYNSSFDYWRFSHNLVDFPENGFTICLISSCCHPGDIWSGIIRHRRRNLINYYIPPSSVILISISSCDHGGIFFQEILIFPQSQLLNTDIIQILQKIPILTLGRLYTHGCDEDFHKRVQRSWPVFDFDIFCFSELCSMSFKKSWFIPLPLGCPLLQRLNQEIAQVVQLIIVKFSESDESLRRCALHHHHHH